MNRRNFLGMLSVGSVALCGFLPKVSAGKRKKTDYPRGRWGADLHQLSQARFIIRRRQRDGFPLELVVGNGERVKWSGACHEGCFQLMDLLQKPNRRTSFGQMMVQWGEQLCLTGTAFTWMVPNMLGTPMELHPLRTMEVSSHLAVLPDYPDGYYRVMPAYPWVDGCPPQLPVVVSNPIVAAQWMMRFSGVHPFASVGMLSLQEICGVFATGLTKSLAPFFKDENDLVVEIRMPKEKS